MDFSTIISEDRIKRAYENGEFKNLPGFGKPLKPDDLSHVPEELRMAYRVMRNAGFSPEQDSLKQEIMTIEDLIKCCENSEERQELQKKLNEKLLRFNSMMEKRRGKTNSAMFRNYEEKINKKLF
ncbi:DnaJ family domain-containing protein [Cytobacillus sp. FJAT-54145]|uniref:DnaJ family domain-containing protein n=1 Tax=Cytobacillus spartinae TaxID=3299023 RepID=A0ABW6KF53_9BACI